MNTERLKYLFNRYYDKTCTPEERNELMERISEGENDPAINTLIDAALRKTQGELEPDNDTAAAILQSIVQADKQSPAIVRPMRRIRFMRVAAAAVILFLLSARAYFYFNKEQKQIAKTETRPQRFKNDVAPGGNKAILTLANGTQIILDSAVNGTLIRQGNTKILKLKDGQLAYNAAGENGEVLYNTISTPRGGQYQVELADGSKVWLNAASSLRFPASFTGRERNVELTGEGYFEVAHNAAMPFHVKVNGVTVEVLGTHFNINAYDDEAMIKTTLLQGSVKVSNGLVSKMIKPGEQAQFPSSGVRDMMVHTVDVNEAVAWKDGRFSFNGADIKTVMRQLGRWYDVDISYQEEVKEKFHVEMSRNTNVSNVFKILETTGGVRFKIEGKKITVMK